MSSGYVIASVTVTNPEQYEEYKKWSTLAMQAHPTTPGAPHCCIPPPKLGQQGPADTPHQSAPDSTRCLVIHASALLDAGASGHANCHSDERKRNRFHFLSLFYFNKSSSV